MYYFIAVSLVVTILQSIVVAVRIFTRVTVKRQQPDTCDWTSIAACVLCWVMFGSFPPYYEVSVLWAESATGTPEHKAHNLQMTKLNMVSSISMFWGLYFSKLSLLLFYKSLSPARWFRWTIRVLIGILTLYTLVNTALPLIGLSPSREVLDVWEGIVDPGSSSYAFCNVAMDLTLMVLPIVIIAPLQMSWRKKLSLSVLFITGIGVTTIALIRAVHRITKNKQIISNFEVNVMLGMIELAFSIMCASMPLLTQFFTKLLPQYKASFYARTGWKRDGAQKIDAEYTLPTSRTHYTRATKENTIIRMNKQRRAEKRPLTGEQKQQEREIEVIEMGRPPSTATTTRSGDITGPRVALYPGADDEGHLLSQPPAVVRRAI